MKIAITGHTSGIGKTLFEHFRRQNGKEVMGFSRTNGFDLFAEEAVEKMLGHCNEADVFINNAPCGFNQSYILLKIADRWLGQPKKIISMSSADDLDHRVPLKTRSYKRALDKTCAELNLVTASCRFYCLKLGWVDTPRVADHVPTTQSLLASQDIVELVEWLIRIPPHIHVPEITYVPWPQGAPWPDREPIKI